MKYPNTFSQLKTIFIVVVTFMLGLQSFQLSAQDNQTVRKANKYFRFSAFNQALPLYESLLKNEPTNFLYNYRTGICYLNSNIETNKCVSYFEAAQKNMIKPNDSTPDFYYYLGHAYQVTNQFDKAIQYLSLSKQMLDPKKDSSNITLITFEIEQCQNGKKAIATPTTARLFNLGKAVNTIYPDYSPVILPNQSMLIFTSTRKGSTGGKLTEQGEYYEDIFTSKWKDTLNLGSIESSFYQPDYAGVGFSTAANAGILVNTKSHDASISIPPDEKRLFLYRKNAVWQSEIIDGKLTKPGKVNYIVNGVNRYESSITLVNNGTQNTLYFVSDQAGGIGGKDIYKSIKQDDGTWGPEENLGPIINTELDEESPFFDSNEGILYFSSQGHNSVGGFDIFKTKFDNDKWMSPKNLGYPVNSGTDDVFYSFNTKENRGYLSTMREDAVGNYDIYMVRYLKPLKVLFAATYSGELKPLEANAVLVASKTKDSVKIALNKTSDINYNYSDKYKILVPHYDSTAITDEFEFETPESYGDYSYYQEINYEALKNHRNQLIGYKTTVYNAFFDIEKEVQKNRQPNLKKVDEYASLVKKLKSENKYFQIHSKTNYIDTTMYAIQAEELAARAMAGSVPAEELAVVEKKEKKGKKGGKAEKETKVAKETKTTPAPVVASTPATKGSAPFKTILFQFSRTTITKEAKAEIENIFAYLKENKDVSMEIIGYTDSEGKSKFNLELSKKRAKMVKSILVKKGISAKRLKTKGMGEKNPVAPNKNDDKSDNKEGRKLNRRVEFVIINAN